MSAKTMTVEEANEQLDGFKAKCKKDAEHLVKNLFPQKVVHLNELLTSEQFSMVRLDNIAEEVNIPYMEPVILDNDGAPLSKKRRKSETNNDAVVVQGTPVHILPNGKAPCNKYISELCAIIKPLIRELIDQANLIKMWITYLIPRIEDGNNFGVSIQEDTMAEARTVETEAATYLDQISRYYMTRAKVISKVAKYPHVDDYRQTVLELDEKEFVSLRLVLCELRNHYASLHDIIMKNIDRIRKPRNCNTDNMY
ncbi:hypothetical protein CAPTEDRAFT_149100 [Capitella teleta]|uniref:Proteasome activator PA28 C-terminal domain-containing protein n=1 Tax=Capitella teleta TaxID=283909 RepID=X1Z5E0_CAPTE|nr:hypothetical protein CAPTEDRAFT_149100 [Capitella teleta]|eukprot:ELU10146.1 hypothetical protein CAPTEDRAFT_149100 [Capitella teleta]